MDLESGFEKHPAKKPSNAQPPAILIALNVGFEIFVCGLLFWYYDDMYNISPTGCAAMVSMALSTLSQLLVQVFTKSFDTWRLYKFLVWGTWNGIWTRFWTELLTDNFEWTISRVLWDQLYGNPAGIFMFVSLSAFWDGHNIDLYLKKNYWISLKASWLIWPAASVAQFYFIPHRYIALFNTLVNFLWTIVLGLIS